MEVSVCCNPGLHFNSILHTVPGYWYSGGYVRFMAVWQITMNKSLYLIWGQC